MRGLPAGASQFDSFELASTVASEEGHVFFSPNHNIKTNLYIYTYIHFYEHVWDTKVEDLETNGVIMDV